MKDEIRILYLKDTLKYLSNENLKYLVFINDDNNYVLNPTPPCFNGHLSALKDYLCYDYDKLSDINKKLYINSYIQLKRVNDNIYSSETKTYRLKRQLFSQTKLTK